MTWNQAALKWRNYRTYKPRKPVGDENINLLRGPFDAHCGACGYYKCECHGTGMRVERKPCGCLYVTFAELLKRYPGDDGATPPRYAPGIMFADGRRVWAAMPDAPAFICRCEPCRLLEQAPPYRNPDIRPCSMCPAMVSVPDGAKYRRVLCEDCKTGDVAPLNRAGQTIPGITPDMVRDAQAFAERTNKEMLLLLKEQELAERAHRLLQAEYQATRRSKRPSDLVDGMKLEPHQKPLYDKYNLSRPKG